MEGIKNHLVKIQVGSVVGIIFFIVSTTAYSIGVKKDIDARLDTMENQYNHVHKWYEALDETQEKIKADDQEQDLLMVEIRTKLANIETILLEIKKQ